MGHIEHSKKSLVPLIDRLNKYPIGLVDNEILREILSLLFSETEAFVASKFPLMEATISELTRATKMNEAELLPVLNTMADKGLIFDMPYGDEIYYLLMPGVIGFIEFTFMKNRTDLPLDKLARLMTEYFHHDPEHGQAKEFFGSKTQLTRSLVYEEHIPVSSEIVSYESARDIVMRSEFGAAGMCYCRHKREHEGKSCKKGVPVEGTCISFNNGARFLTRRGFAVEKTKEELLAIIDMAHALHLTHITDNIRNRPTFICNCCGCCCEIMAGVKLGYYDGVAKSSYIAVIDPEKCDYCGECFTACNVSAIARDKSAPNSRRVSAVNNQVCLGCGACISACSRGAISLVPRTNYVAPPKTKRRMFQAILREKGRMRPYIIHLAKKQITSVFKSPFKKSKQSNNEQRQA
ncbi:MAG: ATP-binding protein [Candidatus Zhuqueibacterota bacterium]